MFVFLGSESKHFQDTGVQRALWLADAVEQYDLILHNQPILSCRIGVAREVRKALNFVQATPDRALRLL